MPTLSVRTRPGHPRCVATYLAEGYLSRERSHELDVLTERLRVAPAVRHVRSYFVPDDETAFHLFEAASPDAVREALERVGLRVDRVAGAEPVRRPTAPAPADRPDP